MTYMLLIYSPDIGRDRTDEEWADMAEPFVAYNEYVKASGYYVDAAPLAELSTATTVPLARRQTRDHRRAVRRDQGVSRRLLHGELPVARRGDRTRCGVSGRRFRVDRGPSGHGRSRRRGWRLTSKNGSHAASATTPVARSRRWRARSAISAWPRMPSPTRTWSRSSAGRATASRPPVGVDSHHRPAARDRSPAARTRRPREAGALGRTRSRDRR